MYIKNFQHPDLQIDELQIQPGEIWCVFGANHSGIDLLPDLFAGKMQNSSADILQLPDHLGLLSFKLQQELFEEELRNDDTDFLGKIDPGTRVQEFLPDYKEYLPLLKAFAMDHCLDLGYRQLSSGK